MFHDVPPKWAHNSQDFKNLMNIPPNERMNWKLYIIVIHKEPQNASTRSHFCQNWPWNQKSGWKQYTGKKGDQTNPHRNFTLSLLCPLPALSMVFIFFIKSALAK
jgi:hypothetical protein